MAIRVDLPDFNSLNFNKNDKSDAKEKDNTLSGSQNDPNYSDNAQLKAHRERLEAAAAHYHDVVQIQVKKVVRDAIKKGEVQTEKKSDESTVHYYDNLQTEVNKIIKTAIKKGKIQTEHEENRDAMDYYHDNIQTEVNKAIKEAIKKGQILVGKKSGEEAKKEWEQYSQDTQHDHKREEYFEFIDTKDKQTDETLQSRTTQETTSSEAAKITPAKILTMNADMKIAANNKAHVHVTFSDPSVEELYFSYKPTNEEIKNLDNIMKKFFLSPTKRDMTLRVMTTFLDSLAKEFLHQLDYEIVQTKLKISSIMSQKDELMAQASAKLIGGISESLVTGTAAAISVGGSSTGLGALIGKSRATKAGMKEAGKVTNAAEESLKVNNTKLKTLKKQKSDLDKDNVSKDSDEYKKLESDIDSVEETIEEQKTLKTKAETTRGELERDQSEFLRQVDLEVAKANGYSQLIGAGKGFITGVTDYYVTINQANIKIQDAMQAQLQLTKDNSRMFMQKSNEYITSLLSSMLSIINSTYQARRGIITS